MTATIPVGNDPGRGSDQPGDQHRLRRQFHRDNTVSVISGRTDTVTATIPVGNAPGEVATNPLTNTAYVSQ